MKPKKIFSTLTPCKKDRHEYLKTLLRALTCEYEPGHSISYKIAWASSEDSEQPVQISFFAGRTSILAENAMPWIILNAPTSASLYISAFRRGFQLFTIIGIKHGFSCINIRQVPWEVLKTEAEGHGFQHLPRDLANVNAFGLGFQHLPRDLANVNTLKNHIRSLLLHKNWKHLLHFGLVLALFCFAFSPMSRERNFHGLCSF